MPEVSNMDILESKITRAIEKISQLRDENRTLREEKEFGEARLSELETQHSALQERLRELEARSEEASQENANLESLRGRVDGILSKFELLDL